MAPPEELLHLLKAGRILQYRQQNVALISAPDGAEFSITYADRWVAPDLRVREGDPAIVVLSDSPYDRVDPVRFATVRTAEHTRAGLELTIAVGPWPVVEGDDALIAPFRAHPTRPPYFVWRGPAGALRHPRSDHETREAWRHAVDRLRGNACYADSCFARVVRVLDPHGRELREGTRGDGRSLELGEIATAVLEVHSPGSDDPDRPPVHSVLVESDPPGSVAGGVENERPDRDHHLFVPIRPLAGGAHEIELSFVPDPLLSTRLRFTIESHKAGPGSGDDGGGDDDRPAAPRRVRPDDEPPGEADPALVQALAERLRRLPVWHDEPGQWLTLLQDHILALAPRDPVVRSMVAEAAYETGEFETVLRMLDDPGRFRSGDALRLLVAGLRYGMPVEVRPLLREIDFDVERNVAELAVQLPLMPDGAVHQIAEAVVEGVAGEEVLDRLLPPVFGRLRDDLALRVARECAPADPAGWLDRALDRWPDPHRMSDEILTEILSWDVGDIDSTALGPYVLEAIEHHVEHGDIDRVIDLDHRARVLLPRPEQVRLRAATARMLFDLEPDHEHPDQVSDQARGLLLAAAAESAGLGDPDLATELAFTLRERWPAGEDDAVDTVVDRLRGVLADLTEFREWRDHRDQTAASALRSALEGRTLHMVGGRREDWADQLAADLGVKALLWHETDHAHDPESPAALDWAAGVDQAHDIVILVWTHTGHLTARGLDAAGVTYLRAEHGRGRILDALTRWVAGTATAGEGVK